MMYAIVQNDVVINIIEWDGMTPYQPPNGCNLHICTDGVDIGWKMLDGVFVNPNPTELNNEILAQDARAKRNRLLNDCDWVGLSDAPAGNLAWVTYRQALRDIPQQAGFPANIDWPVKPE
jgi:hypothetical protein